MRKKIGMGVLCAAMLCGCAAATEDAGQGAQLATQPPVTTPMQSVFGASQEPMQPTTEAGMGAPTPVAMAPDMMAPDTMTPEPMVPETMTPEPMVPETMTPEPMVPETMTPVIPGDGPQPRIPAVSGACPEFRDGTNISVAGHGSIAITAGPAGMGGPLLFYWHGTGSSSREALSMLPASVRQDIKSSGGIIASFNGRDTAGGERDCSGTNAHNMADFKAVDQIVACAVQNHGIDPRRIYSTGCSAGGLQTGCLASVRSSYIAAVAPNSGGAVFPQSLEDPSHIPALMTMHGGSGDNVIVNFQTTSNTLGNSYKGGGGFWVDCNHMSGHCGARGAIQEAAWEFLKAHPFGTKPSPYASGLPGSFPSYCEIK